MGCRKAALTVRKPAAGPRVDAARVQAAPLHAISEARYSNRAGTALVQAKLAVAPPGNVYEQDADHAADQWLRSPKGPIRIRAVSPMAWKDGVAVSPAIARRIDWMRGQGSPLSPALRRQFESRMRRSLTGVRIHTSSEAAELAAMLDARAFASGKDVFFAAGEWQPHTPGGQRLLAHELAHIVQQSQGIAGPGIQREEKTTWQSIKETVGDVASVFGDAAMALVRKFAPGLAEIIDKGPFEYIKAKVSDAIKGWLPDALEGFSIEGILGKVRAGVGAILGKLKGLRKSSGDACKNFAEALGAIRDFIIDVIDNPIFEFFKTNLEKFQSTMVKIGAFVLAPVFDFFRDQAVSTWNAVKKVAGWIWSGIKAVKDYAGSAVEWVLQRLGIDVNEAGGEEGVWGWVKRKADQIWSAIRDTLAPVVAPLKTAIKIGLALSPLGPIYVLIRYGPEVVKSIQWLWENRNEPNLIEKSHKEMGGTILPGILDAITNADIKLKEGVDWLTARVEDLAGTVLDFVGKATGLPLLGVLKDLGAKVSEGLQATMAWARETLKEGAEFFKKVVANVTRIIEPYKEILSSLALAVVNPAMIPIILAGWAWRKIPQCFKVPIIDFVLDIVIRALKAAPDLPMMGLLWPLLKSAVISALETFSKQTDDIKEKLSNKIAKIVSGASLDFLIGFVKGFLLGVWETLTDPIKAIWAIVEGLNKLLELFDKWTGGGATELKTMEAAPKAKAATASASAAAQPPAATPAPLTVASTPSAPTAVPAAEAPAASGEGGKKEGAPDAEEDAEPAPGGENVQLGPKDRGDIGERLGQMGKELQPPAQVVTGQFWTAAEQYFNASGGTSLPQLIAKLGDAWEAVKTKITDESGKLAKKLIDYLISDAADGEIGDKLGYITGLVSTQLLLDFLTAGTTEVLKPLQAVAKFLNWPMELMGKAFKLIGKLGKYVVSWIKKMGSMVKDAAAGAFLAVKDALGVIGSKLVQFAEEIVAKFSKFGGKKVGTVLHEGEKLGESGLVKGVQQEGKALSKAEQKAVQVEQGTAKETVKAGQKAEQEVKQGDKAAEAEKKGQTSKEEAERAAKEKLQAPLAVAEARAILRAGNAVHAPLPLIMAELSALKGVYSWIKYFEPVPESVPGRFEIHMIATDYDIGEVVVGDPPEFVKGKHELNDRGLTKEQEEYYRKLIDNPPAGKTAEGIRFERNRLARKNRGLPELSESEWKDLQKQLQENRRFGIEQENKAREGVKKLEKRPDLKNNNEGQVYQATVKDPKTNLDVTTRPDSIGKNAKDQVDFVHEHKTVTGSDKVVYETDQMRAQKVLLEKTEGDAKHVVSISTDNPKLSAIPPEPRPSAPLANDRTIYFCNKQGTVTHRWVEDLSNPKAGGYWKKVIN